MAGDGSLVIEHEMHGRKRKKERKGGWRRQQMKRKAKLKEPNTINPWDKSGMRCAVNNEKRERKRQTITVRLKTDEITLY